MANYEVDVDFAGNNLTYKHPNGMSADEVHALRGDHFQWCTVRDELALNFDNPPGIPFDAPPGSFRNSHPGAKACTISVTVIRGPGKYPYKAELTLAGATHAADPQVIIDSGSALSVWLVVGATLAILAIGLVVRHFLTAKRRRAS